MLAEEAELVRLLHPAGGQEGCGAETVGTYLDPGDGLRLLAGRSWPRIGAGPVAQPGSAAGRIA